METIKLVLLLKAFLRVSPTFIFMNTPGNSKIPLTFRLFVSFPLVLILSQKFQSKLDTVPNIGINDLLLGVSIGAFVTLFFSAATKASLFFAPLDVDESNEDNAWRKLIDSLFLIVLVLGFLALKLERNLLEVLALDSQTHIEKIYTLETWSTLFADLSWLALKVSSFGFVLVLTQKLFEEIYRKLGGESLKIVFSLSAWLALLAMSPLLLPSLMRFYNAELAEFWRKWLGASL